MQEQITAAADPSVAAFILDFLLTMLVAVAVITALLLLNRSLGRYYSKRPDQAFVKHLIMLAAILFGILFSLVFMPFDPQNRVALLSLFGIALSAFIALSSTNIMGNAVAGIMLRLVGHIRTGDVVRIDGEIGRVTSLDVLHIQVQTPLGELKTYPAMLLISRPVDTLQPGQTVCDVTVSLGYDISHTEACSLLLQAAAAAGLAQPYALVENLGDFSVLYRVAGVPETLADLPATRSRLNQAVLDTLHTAGHEIASPTLVSHRVGGVQCPPSPMQAPDPDASSRPLTTGRS